MKEVSYKDLSFNPMTLIGDEWLLLTAGNEQNGFNTMTVSWAHMGSIWGHNGTSASCVIYVRDSRYTKQFVDREDLFTLTAFPASFKKDLAYLGSHSGRDEDKLAKTSLTPLFTDGSVIFKEAKLAIVCKKLYAMPLREECFIDRDTLESCYPLRDFHTMYVGQIVKTYIGE